MVFLASLLSVGLLLWQVSRQTEASRWLGRSHRTVHLLNTLGRDFYRQQTAVLDYARTRSPRALSQAREERERWKQIYAQVSHWISDQPTLTDQREKLGERYREWETLSDSILAGGGASNAETLRKETALFKETFLIIDRMIELQNSLLTGRDEGEKESVRSTFGAIAAINVALLVIFGVVLTQLYFSIARPISGLSEGMARYQDGDLGTRIPVTNFSQIGFLEATFNEMAHKIQGMVTDLRRLDELKSEFLSTVSHELRTPLTSIAGYVKLLGEGDAGAVSETQAEFLRIVRVNVDRLSRLIDDLLDLEKIELGRTQLKLETLEIADVLRECHDTFEVLADQKGLELRYDVPEKLGSIQGDRERLVQVFMNLLSNAIKYTEKGHVGVRAERAEQGLRVEVSDSGIGMSELEVGRLFQKFYRTASAVSSGERGTGLGLALAKGLVEAHGGSMSVRSKSGEGTEVTVTL